MLPFHGSTPRKGRMHRTGYSNGGVHGAYPMGGSGGSQNYYNFSSHKFQPRSQPALRRRRQLLIRLGLIAVGCFAIATFFSSSLRAAVFGALSLGMFSAAEDFQLETVRYYDLSNVQGTARGWEREERILLCVPLRDASTHLPMFFSHLRNLTYPHNLIDLAFLVGDSKDNTISLLTESLEKLQASENPKMRFGELSIMEKDFGQKVQQDVESRHGFAAQASRRKSMAQARNWLLSAALRPTHSWVYWRDVDVETAPFTILEDLMRHNKDVIVPNVWRPLPDWLGGEQPYDLNSWQESETALALADTLDEDAVIVEGYAEYATWRPHLAYLRDPYGDPDMEMELDGVGGVSILAKAKVFRAGVHFPAFSFEKHAETEGFGKMAKRMQFSVVGLPHYTIWHLYEPSVEDMKHMEGMERERKEKEQKELAEKERKAKLHDQFDIPTEQWDKDKSVIRDMAKQEHTDKVKAGGNVGPGNPKVVGQAGEIKPQAKVETENAEAKKDLPVEKAKPKADLDVEKEGQVTPKDSDAKAADKVVSQNDAETKQESANTQNDVAAKMEQIGFKKILDVKKEDGLSKDPTPEDAKAVKPQAQDAEAVKAEPKREVAEPGQPEQNIEPPADGRKAA